MIDLSISPLERKRIEHIKTHLSESAKIHDMSEGNLVHFVFLFHSQEDRVPMMSEISEYLTAEGIINHMVSGNKHIAGLQWRIDGGFISGEADSRKRS